MFNRYKIDQILYLILFWQKLKVLQTLLYKTYKLIWQWMWLVGFNHLINEYLNFLFIIDDISIYKFNVIKFGKMLEVQTILQ